MIHQVHHKKSESLNVNYQLMNPTEARFHTNAPIFPFPQTAKKNFQYLDSHTKKKTAALGPKQP